MQPNNPANFIGGLPQDSFGQQMPAAQPQAPQVPAQQQQPQQPVAPPDFSQYTAPIQGDPNGFGSFVPTQTNTPDTFGDAARYGQQQGQQQQPVPGQPWVPPAVPQQQPAAQPQYQQPGAASAQYPQPYAQPYVPQQQQPAASDQTPAWAQELTQMLQQTREQGQQQGQQAGWKPRSWDEVIEKSREAASQVLTEQQQAEKRQKDEEEAKVNAIMADIDNQVNQMTFTGQMPAVVNPADPNDVGRSYRRELIGLANATGSTNMYQLNQNLIAAHRAGMVFDAQSGQFRQPNGRAYTPAGQSAPIAGGGGGSPAPAGQLPPISQLRRASMGELMQGLTNEAAQYIGS